jgi:hypothetical protein
VAWRAVLYNDRFREVVVLDFFSEPLFRILAHWRERASFWARFRLGFVLCSKVATKDGKVIKRLSEKISMVADAGHFSDPAVASSYSRIFRPAAEYPVLPARPFKPVRAE